MKTSWRLELPQLVIVAGLFIWSAVLWPSAPERMPVHFDITGTADRYGGRAEGLLLLPAVALGVYLLLRFLPLLDRARANYPAFAGAYGVVRLTVVVVMALIDAALLLPVMGISLNVGVSVRLAVGGLLVVFGSVMGKIRPNWFVGIRTPWTLASKRSRVQTHRLGGWVFLVSGPALMASSAFASAFAVMVVFAVTGAGILCTISYSYLAFRDDPDCFPAVSTRPE
ncbi:MAG: DUF1648 domain-containing protein [Chloroflexi bacterium]|nr:DUF1648 domain-containing protein [Chloroflexota bacterium]